MAWAPNQTQTLSTQAALARAVLPPRSAAQRVQCCPLLCNTQHQHDPLTSSRGHDAASPALVAHPGMRRLRTERQASPVYVYTYSALAGSVQLHATQQPLPARPPEPLAACQHACMHPCQNVMRCCTACVATCIRGCMVGSSQCRQACDSTGTARNRQAFSIPSIRLPHCPSTRPLPTRPPAQPQLPSLTCPIALGHIHLGAASHTALWEQRQRETR